MTSSPAILRGIMAYRRIPSPDRRIARLRRSGRSASAGKRCALVRSARAGAISFAPTPARARFYPEPARYICGARFTFDSAGVDLNLCIEVGAIEIKSGETFFEIIAKQRQSQQIFGRAVRVLAARGVDRLLPFRGLVCAAAHPCERHQIDLLVKVKRADKLK